MKLQLKRSNVLTSGAAKEPTASQLEYGELAINYNSTDPAIFLKDSNNNVIRISGVGNIADDGQVELPASTTPPSNPEAGNLWFNSDEGRLYIYYVDANTSQWVDASPDSYDPSVVPDMSDPNYQAGTLDDRYNSSQVGTTAPAVSTRQEGALWWNSSADEGKLYVLYNDPAPDGRKKWVEASPYPDTSGFVTTADLGNQQDITGGGGLTIDGNVGIGTTSPSAELHVATSADNGGLVLHKTSIAGSTGAKLSYQLTNTGSSAVEIASIKSDQVNATAGNETGNLLFSTTNSGSASEKMRIDSSGNVGIGTNSPGVLLDAAGSNPTLRVRATTTNTEISTIRLTEDNNYVGAYFKYDGSTNLTHIGTHSAADSNIANDNHAITIVRDTRNVGVGTTSPDATLRVTDSAVSEAAQTNDIAVFERANDGYIKIYSPNNKKGGIAWGDTEDPFTASIRYDHNDNNMNFYVNNAEAMRIDSSGRLLVGTSSAASIGNTQFRFNISGTDFASSGIAQVRYSPNTASPSITLAKSRGSAASPSVVQNGDQLGKIRFYGYDGSSFVAHCAEIAAEVDGTPGASDMPGRLVFSTTEAGASSATERMRISANGQALFTQGNTSTGGVGLKCTSTSYNTTAQYISVARSGSNGFNFLVTYSSTFSDVEHKLRGDGNAYADGSWVGGGADYAEYFEWSDGNSTAEDRRGISVVLDGDKIREAVAGEEPIGVISGNPSVVGDAAWNKWHGRYLRDDFGTYVQEDYEVEDDDGNTVVQQRRQLNPDYNPDVEYVSREDRPEWDCVGLMGKLRIRKGQVTGSRWIKMRDISDSVEEWLVR